MKFIAQQKASSPNDLHAAAIWYLCKRCFIWISIKWVLHLRADKKCSDVGMELLELRNYSSLFLAVSHFDVKLQKIPSRIPSLNSFLKTVNYVTVNYAILLVFPPFTRDRLITKSKLKTWHRFNWFINQLKSNLITKKHSKKIDLLIVIMNQC